MTTMIREQFTASEVRQQARELFAHNAVHQRAMLNAFADLLEAREKAVPFGYFGWREKKHMDAEGRCTVSQKAFPELEVTTPVYLHAAPADAERLAEALRMCMDIMLEHGVPTHPDADARIAYTAAEQALAAHSAQAQPPAASVPDINTMVNRFLCWKLPQDFAPDAGISFKPMPDIYMPHCWPTGTNLFHAGQAKEMILYMLAAQEKHNE